MLNLLKMKLFPFTATQISIPTNEEKPYNIIFMSENSDFMSVYPKLNIRRQFAKKITIIPSKNPHLVVTVNELMPYKKSLGLIPTTVPDNSNTFIDTSLFLSKIDGLYGKSTYNRPQVLSKIIPYLTDAKRFGDHNSILMYHVNVTEKEPEQLIERRSYILAAISKVGEGSFPFDCVVLAIERSGVIKFSVIFNKNQKNFDPGRIVSILKSLSYKEEKREEVLSNDPSFTKVENLIIPKDEKDSIMRFIEKHRKNKVIIS